MIGAVLAMAAGGHCEILGVGGGGCHEVQSGSPLAVMRDALQETWDHGVRGGGLGGVALRMEIDPALDLSFALIRASSPWGVTYAGEVVTTDVLLVEDLVMVRGGRTGGRPVGIDYLAEKAEVGEVQNRGDGHAMGEADHQTQKEDLDANGVAPVNVL